MYSNALNPFRRLGIAFAVIAAAAAFLGPAAGQALAGAVISNGTVALGVNDPGDLNYSDGTRFVGVTYEPTGHDGTRAGCPCEGWGAGVADPSGNFSGRADRNFGGASNLDLISFTSTASTATSVVSIDDKVRVTQAFAPSPSTPNLYEIKVTLENIGATTLPDVRYTRLMDWDVEPTPFSEFVTIQRGTTPAPGGSLIRSNDNGFNDPDPFAGHSPLDPATDNADYTDKGPADHGALFDFSFGALAPGGKKEFSIFYGAAANEAGANAAISAAALELYSLGQSNGGQTTGEPTTFIWGFKAVGGRPVIPPTLTLSPKTATNPVGTAHTVTAELRDSAGNPVPGASIVFQVSGANPQAAVTKTTGVDGRATDAYTGTAAGDDAITACLDNNGNGACDADEVTDTATKTWTGGGGGGTGGCTGVSADVTRLWPPNHKYHLVTLTNAAGGTVAITGVTQDEPVNGLGDGDTAPDAKPGPTAGKVYVRAERSGKGDGRVYRIAFAGTTSTGAPCSGTVTVGVPHDNSKKSTPRDSGGTFNSFGS